jgi:hypothetical protein
LHTEVAPDPSESHTVDPVGHEARHTPPGLQTSVPVHSVVQLPAEHVCPCVHAWPHVPQLKSSVASCVHCWPHAEYPEPQDEQSTPPSD